MKIGKDKRVRITIKLQVEKGDVLEESTAEYIHGAGNMLEGLELELEGLEVGAKKKGVIPAAKAFGGAKHKHEKTIPRSEFPKEAKLEEGTSFMAGSGNSEVLIEIVSVKKDSVEALLCHPLAKKNIAFEVEILAISDPAPPPLPSDVLNKG